ncbi:carboxylating nicotinate-nucleotide diphosphorylase [Microbacterium sp. YY-01]|uniref:carboxylating nicotinate-nucleotide diphosphorylase n=1 Tax=Microbacterium sp. YY-01 TaxID=3421634 RepID=UPI003D180751
MLTARTVQRVVAAALEEDAPWGDLTSTAFLPQETQGTAQLIAREAGTLAGTDIVDAAFLQTDGRIRVQWHAHDGDRFTVQQTLATISGPARGIVTAERVALNFLQRMSGVATLTSAFVDAVAGTGVRIADSRKTTPGLRALDRHAVRCGGGHNHRYSLSDAVMVKDNHLALAMRAGLSVSAALRAARERLPHTTHVVVEVDRIDQIDEVLAGGADTILLDNFSPEQLREAVAAINGRAVCEASGGVTLDTVADISRTGVSVISVGALTHSARALDIGLDVVVE